MKTYDEQYRDLAAEALALIKAGKLKEAHDCLKQAGLLAVSTQPYAPDYMRPLWTRRAKEMLGLVKQVEGKIRQAAETKAAQQSKPPKSKDAVSKKADDDLPDVVSMERPSTKLSDVSGMEEAKKFISLEIIDRIRNPAKVRKYGLSDKNFIGLLLYGLPGTGKTFFAKAIAGELGLPFYVIKSSDIMKKWVGDSEKRIQQIFDTARSNPWSVIFIDETNGVLVDRSENVHEVTKSIEDIILQETEGVDNEGKNPFLLIGATNYPGKLDDAALSRFGCRIEVELPDETTRRRILERELKKMEIPIEEGVFDFLVSHTQGFSCRDLGNLADELKRDAGHENIQDFSLEFCRSHFRDNHVQNASVARAIEEFKERIGGDSLGGSKKKVTDDTPESPDTPDTPDTPDSPDSPDSPDTPDTPESPESPEPQEKAPGLLFSDIKGLDEAKEAVLNDLIYPMRYPDIYKSLRVIPGSGLLLYGPPGTGKTMFARCVSNELNCEFIGVSFEDVKGKDANQTIARIHSLFEKARQCERGCVLFFDDCEQLLSRPGRSNSYGVSQFLVEMDGLKQPSATDAGSLKGKVFLMIATNRPDLIDEALLRSGRICRYVYVGLPNLEARKEIIANAMKDVPMAEDVDLNRLAELTEGYSGADIYHSSKGGGICNLACMFAAVREAKRREECPGEEPRPCVVCWNDFEMALSRVGRSADRNAQRIQALEEFRKKVSNALQEENRKDEPPAPDTGDDAPECP